ncbi:hypothetical protein ACWET9_22560 [Streptomyces sp. NPDC004059]
MATDKERRAQHRHQHKQRVIRGAPEELWTDLDTATKAAGTDRSAVTRQFWEWYVRRPSAELPDRPASSEEKTT